MKTKIVELKKSGKIFGREEVPVYETLEELTKDYSEKKILDFANRQIKNITLRKAELTMKKDAKDQTKISDYLKRKWMRLTSNDERSEFCSHLGIDLQTMTNLTEPTPDPDEVPKP